MGRRLALAAVVAVLGMAFLMAPATAGSTVTRMRLELGGGGDVAARSQMSGSVSLWAKSGSAWAPLGGATLSVVLDGQPMGSVVTDGSGFAVVPVPADLAPGGHVMKVTYAGDGVHAKTQRSHGFSVSSGGGSACTSEPDAPELLAADTTAPGQVTLLWTPPVNDGGCALTAFNVWRGPDHVGSAAGSAISFVDMGVPAGLNFYTVTAVNGAGESLPSNVMVVSV